MAKDPLDQQNLIAAKLGLTVDYDDVKETAKEFSKEVEKAVDKEVKVPLKVGDVSNKEIKEVKKKTKTIQKAAVSSIDQEIEIPLKVGKIPKRDIKGASKDVRKYQRQVLADYERLIESSPVAATGKKRVDLTSPEAQQLGKSLKYFIKNINNKNTSDDVRNSTQTKWIIDNIAKLYGYVSSGEKGSEKFIRSKEHRIKPGANIVPETDKIIKQTWDMYEKVIRKQFYSRAHDEGVPDRFENQLSIFKESYKNAIGSLQR